MNDEQVKALVSQAVREALLDVLSENQGPCVGRCCETCELDAKRHGQDHEFIGEVRQTLQDGKRTLFTGFFKLLGWGVVIGLAGFLGIKVAMK